MSWVVTLDFGVETVLRTVRAQSAPDAISIALNALLLERRAAGVPMTAGALVAGAVRA